MNLRLPLSAKIFAWFLMNLVLLAVGAFGGVLRPVAPELISGWSDVLFAGGVLTSMVVRYHRPQWYANSPMTLIERLLDRVR